MIHRRPGFCTVSIALVLVATLGSSPAFGAKKDSDFSPDDVVAELKTKLDLNDQQVKELMAALGDLAKKLDALISERESAGEEEDPHAFIEGVKQAQEDYQKKLSKILSASQLKSYEALKEAAINDTMKDLAEIKLLDIQPKVQYSDDQLKQLVPVLADSMQGLLKIAWEHAGKHLRLRQKIKIARDLKRIQSKSQERVEKILSPEQFKKWEELKGQR